MKHTVFLLGFLPNPRMYKRFALAQEYSDVQVICWDRAKEMMPLSEKTEITFSVIRADAGSNYVSRMVALKKFQKKARVILEKENPDIIHVQHLDMLQIACRYKKRHPNVHIIYEVADLHRLLVDEQKSIIKKLAQKYLLSQDKKCSKMADILIVTSQKYYDTYFHNFVPEDKLFYFPNVPDLSVFDRYKPKDHSKDFTIGFFGGIRYKEEMRLLINCVIENNIPLIIAGFEQGGNEIEEMCKGHKNIVWLGKYDFKESAAELYGKCDCVYSVYNASMANCRVALPNKLYEAVYCELPIIVASNTHVADIVEEWNVGISVIHNSQESIEEGIRALLEMERYQKYVAGCKEHKCEIDLKRYNSALKERILKLF